MDLPHGGRLDGFCLVSSDSDFTRLATRLREAGLAVYGFGEQKTPQAFVAACDKFIYTEILRPQQAPPVTNGTAIEPLQPLLSSAVTASARDNGWALLAAVGSLVLKTSPAFDPRNYGCQKLGELVRKQPYLEVRETPIGDGSANAHLHVRLKPA